MTNRIRTFQSLSLLALASAAATVPVACAPESNSNVNTPAAAYSAPYGTASSAGYPGYPSPAGYPAQPGYPQPPQPAGYPPQPQAAGYPQTPQQPAYPAPGPTPPGVPAPAASGSSTPLGPVVTNDPNQLSQLFAQAAQAAQAFLQPPGSAGGGGGSGGGLPTSLADAGIKALAISAAAGMSAEGQEATGTLQEGGHLSFMVPMQGGKCYTLIGFSPPGQIKNVDLNLLAPPFYNVLAGQDTSDDNAPIIGKAPRPMCPIIPVALNYKVDIVARSGSGSVAVQLYSKSK
jgi:hypothetical protein